MSRQSIHQLRRISLAARRTPCMARSSAMTPCSATVNWSSGVFSSWLRQRMVSVGVGDVPEPAVAEVIEAAAERAAHGFFDVLTGGCRRINAFLDHRGARVRFAVPVDL